MKPFAEILAADINAAFLNLGEFADEHDLNGVICMAVVQNINANGTLTTPGNIHRDDLIIFGSHVMVNVGVTPCAERPRARTLKNCQFLGSSSRSTANSTLSRMSATTLAF